MFALAGAVRETSVRRVGVVAVCGCGSRPRGTESDLPWEDQPTNVSSQRQRAAEVVVVDYGLGNLRSAVRGLERAGASVEVTAGADEIAAADGVVLPGVGAFSEGMENADPLRADLLDAAASGTPLFGICLGMQMLLTESEEAERAARARSRA